MEGFQSASQTTFCESSSESSHESSPISTPDPLFFDVEDLPRPYPLHLVHLYEDYRCAELNGVSCSLSQFVDLLGSSDEKFELFDGQIVCVPRVMCDRHSEVRDAAAAAIRNSLREQGLLDQYDVRVEVTLDPSRPVTPSTRGRQQKLEKVSSALIPDVLVQAIIATDFRDTLSPVSKKITSPRGSKRILVVEVVVDMTAQRDVIVEKRRKYANGEVEHLLLVILDANRKRRNPRVSVGTLKRNADGSVHRDRSRNASYSFQDYKGEQRINCPPCLIDCPADSIVHPRQPSSIIESPIRRMQQQLNQKDEQLNQKDEQLNQKDEQLNQKDDRINHLEALLYGAGGSSSIDSQRSVPTSSSSRTSRQRQRR